MPDKDLSTSADTPRPNARNARTPMHWALKWVLWAFALVLSGLACVLMVLAIAMAVAFPNLPDLSELSDYRPKLPLRVYSTEGILIGEFGEERRRLTPIKDIPKVMIDAVLAIEDARFYQHGGVDYLGIVRAGLANVGKAKSQGASTITMQVEAPWLLAWPRLASAARIMPL